MLLLQVSNWVLILHILAPRSELNDDERLQRDAELRWDQLNSKIANLVREHETTRQICLALIWVDALLRPRQH